MKKVGNDVVGFNEDRELDDEGIKALAKLIEDLAETDLGKSLLDKIVEKSIDYDGVYNAIMSNYHEDDEQLTREKLGEWCRNIMAEKNQLTLCTALAFDVFTKVPLEVSQMLLEFFEPEKENIPYWEKCEEYIVGTQIKDLFKHLGIDLDDPEVQEKISAEMEDEGIMTSKTVH